MVVPLARIQTEYKEYVKNSQTDIFKMIDDLSITLQNVNASILSDAKSSIEVNNLILDFQKKLQYALIIFKNFELTNPKHEKLESYSNKLDALQDDLQILQAYRTSDLLSSQNKHLEILAWINIIFLPLALITGFFGMNFESMGAPTNNRGILSIKYGVSFVFFLFFLSILVIWLMRNKYFKLSP